MHNEKKCSSCSEVKSLDQFHLKSKSKDGHQYRCIACSLEVARAYYLRRRDHIIEYQRTYRRSLNGKAVKFAAGRTYCRANRHKKNAWAALERAVRSGRIRRLPCEVCGNLKSQAHHEDYSKPLEVRWLCDLHHKAAHGVLVDRVLP